MEISNEQLEQLTINMSEKIKPCPKCGKRRQISAVFETNDSPDIIGWLQWCRECDNDTDVPMLSIEELDWEEK